jgi:putative spermidine/putrescine transport system substrate-binding protein
MRGAKGMTHMRDSKLTRRELLGKAGATGLAVGLGSAAGGGLWAPLIAQAQPKQVAGGRRVEITEFSWVGTGFGVVPREVKRAYEKAHPNVAITLLEGTNAVEYPKMVAQRAVNPDRPLAHFGFFNVDAHTKGLKDDMWLNLDPKKIPNMANVYDNFRVSGDKGVGWGLSSVGLLYNKRLVREAPTSWNDIFAPRFKGKVMLFDYAWGFNGLLGVIHANGGTARDAGPAFERFSRAAQDGQFLAVFTSTQQMRDALVRGEALLAPYFTSDPITWSAESSDSPIGYAIPREGAVAFTFYFNILKGSTPDQIEVASDVINTYLWKETIARYCNFTALVPAVKGAKVRPQLSQEAVFQAAVIEKAIQPDWAAVAEQNNEWRQRWDREVKARMR